MEGDTMPEIRAHRRITIGRDVALTAAAVYAIVRALKRLTDTPSQGSVDDLITYGGTISWACAARWALAAALCVLDMIKHHTRYGLPLFVGICLAWGAAHLGQWAYYGFKGWGWAESLA